MTDTRTQTRLSEGAIPKVDRTRSEAGWLVLECRELADELESELAEFEAKGSGHLSDLAHLRVAAVQLREQRNTLRTHNRKDAI